MTKVKLSALLISAMMVGCVLIMAGCESAGAGGSSSNLPQNPVLDVSSRQAWTFVYKEYDHTFRIRWPTYFATDLGVGPGSYTLVNGERAEFRNYDDDSGRRASYSLRGPSSRLGPAGTEVTCVLYSPDGAALGWFKTVIEGAISGSLPQ